MHRTFTSPQQPTFYFIGVTTARSSARQVFPAWMQTLGRPDVHLEGLDFPLHDSPANYRACVEFLKRAPLALGGLVTTHKIDLFDAAHDLFDELDPDARALGEVSAIAKRPVPDGASPPAPGHPPEPGSPAEPGPRLVGYVSDPLSGGNSLDALLGGGYFGRTGAQVLIFGAGGSAAALALHLLRKPDPADRPTELIVVNRSAPRLHRLEQLLAPWRAALPAAHDLPVRFVLNEDPHANDQLLAALPPGSIVANATGMGKDRPGSPVTDAAPFPHYGIVWDFNYRGELDFLRQAQAVAGERHLHVEDGWDYFVRGWAQVIAYVLDLRIDEDLLRRLSQEAAAIR
jgi:shikimate 5-dehydrogenase